MGIHMMSAVMSDNRKMLFRLKGPWRRTIVSTLFLILLITLAYGGTLLSMVATWWRSETFAHGFLILPISLYLIWRCREQLLSRRQQIEWAALPILLGMVFLWLAAHVANILVVQQLAVVSMVVFTVLLLFGRIGAYAILFPLLYLYFMVPVGEFLVPRLQDITASITVWALQLSGIPVFWEGLHFSIPSGSFEVAEACSGIRYLIASLALGILYAYLMYTSNMKRLVFIALSIIVPIVANGLRAYGIVLIADLSDYKLATGVDHLIYGWLFFGLVMVILFWAGGKFRDPPAHKAIPTAMAIDTGVPTGEADPPGIRRYVIAVLLASFIIGSGPLLAGYLDARSPINYAVRVALPDTLPGFPVRELVTTPQWAPRHVGAAGRVAAVYQGGQGALELYVAYYAHQEQGDELVQINSHYLPPRWVRVEEKINDYRLEDGSEEKLRMLRASRGGQSVILFQEYYIDGRYTASAAVAKLYEIAAALTGRKRISAIIMFSANEAYLAGNSTKKVGVMLSALHRNLRFSIEEGQGTRPISP